ncbi:hypothetical protein [Croceicoccus mobilis]|uniref:DUF4019 domain-containing protein n=1 Tax=Croceicoccus mobilis TaxID=1703339 RepID=A0A917DUL6_9SPHN|nr:hypothetical protein [Croceicoccus mobilis]GGD68665.1 hypothetical protein GCM10010990_17760 [Croceicoccus mobilis]
MSQTSLIARMALAATPVLALAATPASAQQAQPAAGTNVPPVAAAPVPGEMELAQLIWSTMVAIEHANASGNYTVLRDTAATGFQINNDPAKLAQIFAGLRSTRIDLSTTLVTAPRYTAPPRQLRPDVFQVQGYFPLRPRTVVFDLAFQWQNGRWRLFGVSVEPRVMLDQAEGAKPAAK